MKVRIQEPYNINDKGTTWIDTCSIGIPKNDFDTLRKYMDDYPLGKYRFLIEA